MYEVTCLDLDGNTINNFFQWDIDQKIVIKVKGRESDYLRIEPEVHFSNSKRNEALVVRSLRTGTINVDSANVMSQPSADSKVITTLKSGDKIVYSEYVSDAENVGTAYETSREWCVFEYRNANRYIKSENITRDMETITVSVPNILLQEPYPLLVYVYLTDSDDVSSQRTVLYTEIPIRKRAKPHDYMYVENITRITANLIKDELEARVSQTSQNAINEIDTNKESFIATGNALVATATEIKDNTQKIYNNTVAVANNTKSAIEKNINNLITNNGLSLKATDDGNGNVTIAILVNKS